MGVMMQHVPCLALLLLARGVTSIGTAGTSTLQPTETGHMTEAVFNLDAGPAVPRMQWSLTAMRSAIARRQPTVFVASAVDTWLARTLWQDPQHFLRSPVAPQVLADVAVGPVNWNWDPAQSLCQLVGHQTDGCSSEACPACRGLAAHQRPLRNVTLERFLTSLRAGRKMIYYSPIDREFAGFAEELDFRDALEVLETQELTELRGHPNSSATAFEPALTYVWLGGNGVATQCHYDLSHNVHAVLSGRKTFFVSDPKAYTQLLLYPRSHPGNTKSQMRITEPKSNEEVRTAVDATTTREVAATKVELLEGDLLYLPPTFFHHVISSAAKMDEYEDDSMGATNYLSVSTNLWSYSAEYAAWEALVGLPLPNLFGPVDVAMPETGDDELCDDKKMAAKGKDDYHRAMSNDRASGLLSWALLVVEIAIPHAVQEHMQISRQQQSQSSKEERRRAAACRWMRVALDEGRFRPAHGQYKGCVPRPEQRSLAVRQEELIHLEQLHSLQSYAEGVRGVLSDYLKDSPGRLGHTVDAVRELLVANYLDEVATFVLGPCGACSFFLSLRLD